MRAPAPVSHMAPKQNLDNSQSYILMVQHLIEKCLLLYMDREECVKALATYARVKPVVTVTVWKELEKENKEFFTAYTKHRGHRQVRVFSKVLEEATTKLCSQTLDCPACDAQLQPGPKRLTL